MSHTNDMRIINKWEKSFNKCHFFTICFRYRICNKVNLMRCPAILAINKIDTVEKEKLLEVIAVYSQTGAFDAIIPISAKSGDRWRRSQPRWPMRRGSGWSRLRP